MGSVSNRVLLCRWTTVNQVLINTASHLLSKIHGLCVQLIGALHAPLILSSPDQAEQLYEGDKRFWLRLELLQNRYGLYCVN